MNLTVIFILFYVDCVRISESIFGGYRFYSCVHSKYGVTDKEPLWLKNLRKSILTVFGLFTYVDFVLNFELHTLSFTNVGKKYNETHLITSLIRIE